MQDMKTTSDKEERLAYATAARAVYKANMERLADAVEFLSDPYFYGYLKLEFRAGEIVGQVVNLCR